MFRFSGFGKFPFNIHCITGNVLAALAEEEPDKDEDGTAEDEEANFNRQRPIGSKEDEGVDDT